MTLHDAIAEVLRRNGNRPMHAEDIAAEVHRLGLYRKKDGSAAEPKQVTARMTKDRYRHLFEPMSGSFYRLR